MDTLSISTLTIGVSITTPELDYNTVLVLKYKKYYTSLDTAAQRKSQKQIYCADMTKNPIGDLKLSLISV